MKMNRWKKNLLALGLLLALSACSSSQSKEEENSDGVIPMGDEAKDAGTDAVPLATTEAPQSTDTQQAAIAAPGAQAAQKETAQSAVSKVTSTSALAMSGQTEDYRVQSGDTLMKIAFE